MIQKFVRLFNIMKGLFEYRILRSRVHEMVQLFTLYPVCVPLDHLFLLYDSFVLAQFQFPPIEHCFLALLQKLQQARKRLLVEQKQQMMVNGSAASHQEVVIVDLSSDDDAEATANNLPCR